MRKTTFGLFTTLLALSSLAYACGSADLSGFRNDPTGAGDPSKESSDGGALNSPSPATGASDLTPVDNAVILVHAAKAQAFRLCFKNEGDRRPQPDSQVMPNANVVGVEVGSAVRLAPLRGAPGQVYLFEEPLIRASYPQFGGAGAGPSCDQLLASQTLSQLAIKLGEPIATDLSRGVHLLVVRGCPGNSVVNTYSVAECGATWTAATGNLGVTEITLPGAKRVDGTLPTQVVNLSQPLESTRGARSVVIAFGDLKTPGATLQPVATNPKLFGVPSPQANVTYDSSDTAIYDSVGFRVSLAAPGNPDGGADGGVGVSTPILDGSLARIQKLSSPRDLPPTYYAAASNYALLLLGDPGEAPPDGGVGDERRSLHFLAVPVIDPKDDDAGSGPADGGAAPPP